MKFLDSFLCMVLGLMVYAMQAQTITGSLISGTGDPVSFAVATLNQPKDTALVKAVVANERGQFIIQNPPEGPYLLRIESLGFADYQKRITYQGVPLDLGTIIMVATAESLDEVTVTAQKPMVQVMPDKTVFNVANTVNATGTSAFELLRKAPGVIIDNAGNIILEGKSGVQLFIDGKLSVLQGEDLNNYLESLQATDIEAVEIITQPSSRYDAAGNAGIINIQLKKDQSLGTNGSVTTGFTVGDFIRVNSSINFNIRGKQSNLYGSYSNRYGKNTNFLNLLRTQAGTSYGARTQSINDRNSNNLRLGYDYYASKRSTLGAVLNLNLNNNFAENDTRTPIRELGSTTVDSLLVSDTRTSNQSFNGNANLNYRYKDTLGYLVNVDMDYGRYTSDRFALQPNIYFEGNGTRPIRQNTTSQNTPIDITIATVSLDYEQNLLRGKLGLGGKLSYVDTDNTFDFFNRVDGEDVFNASQSNQFRYTERINAAYVNFQRKWEKWNLQLGLRMEHTVSEGDLESTQQGEDARVARNYTDFFPSGGLTYRMNPNNQLALTYSKRIQRPNYQSLNPFEYVLDELSFRKGNPFLQPQYTDNLKLSHTYKYRLTTSLSYSYVSDFFAQVTVAADNGRNFITTRNVADNEVINLGISYPHQLKKWWNLYVSLNAYISSYKANSPEFLAVRQETLSLYAQNTFTFLNGTQMEISGWYSSPSVWGGTYETASLGSLNIAFQKRFFEDKLTARLAFNDVLFTTPWNGTTQFGDLFIDGSGGSDSRQVAFGLTYNFGRDTIKKARERKTGLEDERTRIQN